MSVKQNTPSNSPAEVEVSGTFRELMFLNNLAKDQEKYSEELAEDLFEYITEASDADLYRGNISLVDNVEGEKKQRLNHYIEALNLLFYVSRNSEGGIRDLSRTYIEQEQGKVYTFLQCIDGGISTDTLCDIVNVENQARMPGISPQKPQLSKLVGDR